MDKRSQISTAAHGHVQENAQSVGRCRSECRGVSFCRGMSHLHFRVTVDRPKPAGELKVGSWLPVVAGMIPSRRVGKICRRPFGGEQNHMAGRTTSSHKGGRERRWTGQRPGVSLPPLYLCNGTNRCGGVVCSVHVSRSQHTTALQPRGVLECRCRRDCDLTREFAGRGCFVGTRWSRWMGGDVV